MNRAPYVLHVTPDDGIWSVHEEETPDTMVTFESRAAAEDHAKDMAQAEGSGEIVLYDEAGGPVERYTYPREAGFTLD
jgi:hypothetical protein